MKIGAPVWYGHKPFEKRFKDLAEIGFDYFEISLDFPFPEKEKEEIEKVRDFDIDVAFHAPLEILLASPRKEIFRSSLKVLMKCLDFASRFEPLYFNFHVFHFTPTLIFPEILKVGLKNFKRVVKLALKQKFPLCVENDMFLLEEFLLEDLKVTLDIGHLALDSKRWGEDYKKKLMDFLEKYKERILVSHVHDVNFVSLSDHLPLGSGHIDLEILKYFLKSVHPKYILLEVFWREPYEAATNLELKKSFELLKSLI